MGRLYPFVSTVGSPARELAHSSGNDIVEALTGEPGIFRTRILMSCGDRKKEIYIMDFDGQNVRQLTRDGNFALSPSWSSDGKRILFTSYKPATRGAPLNPNLYLYDLVTSQRRILSAARGLNTGGVFHPREEKIAYTFSQKGKPEIYILDMKSSTRWPITRTQFFSVEPFFSPDGQKITFSSSQTGRPHIYVANADGTSSKRLTFAGVYNSSPNWSPRGDKIVFSGQENMRNNFNIFMIDPSGSNLVRLTDGSHSSENPAFSADGRHLAFSSNSGGKYRINVMTARGTKIRVLSPASLGSCKQPAWSPRL
jgi:TolB protein